MSSNPFAGIQGFWGQAETGSRIFVSYRRGDSRGDAGRLTDKLKSHFGEKQIFRDVEAIEAGVDFVEALNQAVSRCAALLAVIGPNWVKIADERGQRRLDDPNDFVRLEIAAALQRDIRVIPVLVGGAVMPKSEDLPPGLESLARRQAHELSDPRWDFDVGQLIETLEKAGIRPARRPRAEVSESRWSRNKVAIGVGGALLMIAGYIYSEFEDDIDELLSPSVAVAPGNLQGFQGANLPLANLPLENPKPRRESRDPEPVSGRLSAISPQNSAEKKEEPRRLLSYQGLDAIGRYPTLVQVLNPG